MSVSSVKNLNGETFSAVQDLELTNFVQTNSGSWTGAEDLSAYVRNDTRWLAIGADNYIEIYNAGSQLVYDSFAFGNKNSAASTAVSFGSQNTASNQSFVQGNRNSAYKFSFTQGNQNFASGANGANGSFAQGLKNSAYSGSFAQGSYNLASGYSFAQGGKGNYSNSAIEHSFTQGARCISSGYSFAQGNQCYASSYSIAQGNGVNASSYSQAFGRNTKATNSGMAIGTYNETDSAAFVIGNGTGANSRSDAFIVYHDGSVSAAGKISANGVELGYNETVLWNGTDFSVGNGNKLSATVQLSEPVSAFNEVKIISSGNLDSETIVLDTSNIGVNGAFTWVAPEGANTNWVGLRGVFTDQTHLKVYGGYSNSISTVFTGGGWWNYKNIYKIIGINRIANN